MIEQLSAGIVPGIVAKEMFETEIVRDNARNLEKCVQLYEEKNSMREIYEFAKAANFHEKIRKKIFFVLGSSLDIATYLSLLNSAYYFSQNRKKEAAIDVLMIAGIRIMSAFSSNYLRKKSEKKINKQYDRLNELIGEEAATRVYDRVIV